MEHRGEVAVQRRAGVRPGSWGSARVGAAIPPVAGEFLARQRMVVIGAAADDGSMWAGALTGPDGFIQATDERIVVADRAPEGDDPLAGLFDSERDIGMLAIEPASRRRMRIIGRATRSDGGLTVRTDQVYSNCPKYIQTRHIDEERQATRPERARTGHTLTAAQRQAIEEADTFFIATRAAGLGADVSHRGGNPGFVTVAGETRLTWPDYVGNSMYMTLGNLELDERCGLLFLDWERGHALHLTGRARVDWDEDRAGTVPGAQRLIDFELERAVHIDGALPVRWSFDQYSKFNPS